MSWHARLSASTAARWMNCTGSIRLIATLPEGRRGGGQSEFAALGTAAHLLGSHCLTEGIESSYDLLGGEIVIIGGDAYWKGVGGNPKGPAEFTFEVDVDMADAVDVYLDTVKALREEIPGNDEQVEVQMDMSWLHPAFGGTADYKKAEAFGLLCIVDYKHGEGVVVEVKNNNQLRKYAVGALRDNPDCDRVRVYIVQPRASHPDGPVRHVEYTREELDKFAVQMVVAAEETEGENAPLAAGEWCRFCPAKSICPEIAAEAMRQAAIDFDDEPEPIPLPDNIGQVLKWVPVFDSWLREMEAVAQRALESGQKVEGQKLVRKKAPGRKWYEEDDDKLTAKVMRIAKKLGLAVAKRDMFSEPKIKSPNMVEGMGKGMKKAIRELWYMPENYGVTMASEDDPRAAVEPTCQSDFNEDEEVL